jgi:hypothetical protein
VTYNAESLPDQASINSAERVGCSKYRSASSRKWFLKLIVHFFCTSTSFDNNRQGMLIGYARVSTFIPASR